MITSTDSEEVKDLDEQLSHLEEQCSLLLALLRDRHIGLMSWQYITDDRMTAVVTAINDIRGQ